jgi:Na+-translocating ferredoxin:NAD+ oxidoreductase RnfD subunit
MKSEIILILQLLAMLSNIQIKVEQLQFMVSITHFIWQNFNILLDNVIFTTMEKRFLATVPMVEYVVQTCWCWRAVSALMSVVLLVTKLISYKLPLPMLLQQCIRWNYSHISSDSSTWKREEYPAANINENSRLFYECIPETVVYQ